MNRYFSGVRETEGEYGDQLQPMFEKAFNAFAKSCVGHFPQRVIVYRNGVGDGQKQALLEQEF